MHTQNDMLTQEMEDLTMRLFEESHKMVQEAMRSGRVCMCVKKEEST